EGGAAKNREKQPDVKESQPKDKDGKKAAEESTAPAQADGREASPRAHEAQGNGKGEKPSPASAREPAAPSSVARRLVPAGPATRRLARELGVDLTRVSGTAHGGRVTPEDVKAYVRTLESAPSPMAHRAPQAPPLPNFEKWGPI